MELFFRALFLLGNWLDICPSESFYLKCSLCRHLGRFRGIIIIIVPLQAVAVPYMPVKLLSTESS